MTDDAISLPDIAARLRWLRLSYGMTQTDFARSIGAQPNQYNNWERGKSRLSLDGALAIRRVYSVSLDFLYLGRADTLPRNLFDLWVKRKSA